MERFVLRQNIAIFQRALERETDLAARQIVWGLLADAEAELARLEAESLARADATAPQRSALEIPIMEMSENKIASFRN